MYFIVCGQRLDWGFVDQLPLIPAVAAAMHHLFPGSLVMLRLLPALAHAVTIGLAAATARLLGGGVWVPSAASPAVQSVIVSAPSRREDQNVMTIRGTVRTIFNYTRDTGIEPEIYFYNPAHGAEGRRPGDDPREMTVPMGGIVQPCFLWIARGLHCVIFARCFNNGTMIARSVSGSTARQPNSSA
jgi:hypothetical protein